MVQVHVVAPKKGESKIMEYVILRIIKRDGYSVPGDIVTVSPLLAQRLIDDGIAERYVRKENKDQENGN